jgi:transcriptional regulator with GAF, ATPase, and Fis domain
VSNREALLTRTFVAMADTMVGDFDLIDFFATLAERCVELFDAEAAGLMLADSRGDLQLLASSSERMRLLELFELQRQEGPCLECFQSGRMVDEPDLDAATERWPGFASEASRVGFRSATALPLRLRHEQIGALNLFRSEVGLMNPADVDAAQALADVATIGLLHHRAGRETRMLAEQLSFALNNRVTIEQAKGVVAEQLQLPIDEAFDLLRRFTRERGLGIVDVAVQLVDGELSAQEIQEAATRPSGSDVAATGTVDAGS